MGVVGPSTANAYEAPWELLREARVFVTGGTGYLGRPLLQAFARANRERRLGASLVALTRDPGAARRSFAGTLPDDAYAEDSIEFVRGDVSDFEFPKGGFTHLIHGAASPGDRSKPENADKLRSALVAGTRRMIALAAASRKPRFLFLSSGAAHFHSARSDVYGEGKREGERLCLEAGAAGGLEPVIARLYTFVGPTIPLDGSYALGNFIRDGRAGGPIRVSGDGTAVRSYLYTGDMATWLWTLLLRGEAGATYDVGSDQAVSVRELADLTARIYLCQYEVARQPTPGAPVDRYVPVDLGPARSLGLEAWTPLEEAIRLTERELSLRSPA